MYFITLINSRFIEILVQFKITVFCFNIFSHEFPASSLQSSVLHNPSEIILICWFAAWLLLLLNY